MIQVILKDVRPGYMSTLVRHFCKFLSNCFYSGVGPGSVPRNM